LQHDIFQAPDIGSFRDAAAAIIVTDDGRYLMQERDDTPGIFYPDHWGLFGGAFEPAKWRSGVAPGTSRRTRIRAELNALFHQHGVRFRMPRWTPVHPGLLRG
jgi:hypothetical protein